jgi:hypothetical protein
MFGRKVIFKRVSDAAKEDYEQKAIMRLPFWNSVCYNQKLFVKATAAIKRCMGLGRHDNCPEGR